VVIGLLAALVALAALGVAGVWVIALRERPSPVVVSTPTPAPPAPTATPPATATVAATEPVTPVTPFARLRVDSDPPGASIREEGLELCSATPCEIFYKGADAEPARLHELSFARAGYRGETMGVRVGDTPVLVKLVRVIARAPTGSPADKGPSAPPRGAPPLEIPY